MTPGERLAARLAELKWTRNDLADLTGADLPLISRWIRGTRVPTLDRAVAIERSELGLAASIWVPNDADQTGPRQIPSTEDIARAAGG